jgi:hypothetical protein
MNRSREKNMKLRSFAVVAVAALSLQAVSAIGQDKTLDYGFFTSRVEPIFLKKRETHARCYTCHSESNNAFRLEKLSPGSNFWSDEQSRKNFQSASSLAVPGDRDKSRLLLQPLAPQAGGNPYHSGGRQFANRDDPDWKVLAQWVDGAKAPAKK